MRSVAVGIAIRLFLILAIFAGGFYSGTRFAEHQYIKDPAKFANLMKKSVKEGAKKQLEKAKELLDN